MFTEVKLDDAIKLQNKKPGTSFIATLVDCKEIRTEYGPSNLWKFKSQKEGKTFTVWGFASLDYKLCRVEPGSLVRVTFEGESKVRNNYGKFPYLVKVEVDSDSGNALKKEQEYLPDRETEATDGQEEEDGGEIPF